MLEVKNIKKSYGSNNVLKDVSFSVKDGEIFGLIGVNGAGKTTLISILAGLLKADGGQFECTKDTAGAKIGYLPDIPNFYDYLSAGEYLDFLLKYKNPQRRSELLKLVSISENVKISAMSRGMRQRLGIAAAIVNDPDIILLDEPTSALDPVGRQDVMKILSHLKSAGKTILLSTHILADMEKICDKVGFLSDGIIKKSLYISELSDSCEYIRVSFEKNSETNQERAFREAGLEFERVGQFYRFRIDPDNPLMSQKKIMEVLSKTDAVIHTINTETESLDEIFKSLI